MCFEAIDSQKKEKIGQIEQYRMRLISLGYINNPDLIHHIDVLQMINLRVMEIETVELQKLKAKNHWYYR